MNFINRIETGELCSGCIANYLSLSLLFSQIRSSDLTLKGLSRMLDFLRKKKRSWIITILLGLIIVVFIAFYGGSQQPTGVTSHVAEVNGESISQREFIMHYQRAVERYREMFKGSFTPELLKNLNIKQSLLEEMIEKGASDLHVTAGERPKLRVDGHITDSGVDHVLTPKDCLQLTYSILTENQKKRFETEDELDFSFGIQNLARFRGNVFKQRGCVSMVIRMIPFNVRTFQDLGLPPVVAKLAERPRGLILVTGMTGSGKSTTLASMIDYRNERMEGHIITIEDPIEYVHEQKKSIIDQREIGIDTDDFSTALQSAFRQDVNVIMIGEMRTPETISTAVTAAETGHLVLSTLHTNNASQTIDRIIDSSPAEIQDQIRVQLAGSLLGIFSQRLIPRISGGRVPAYELLINNNAVANLIRERRTHEIDIVIETGQESGMIDMNRSLVDLVARGEISMEDAYKYSLNPKALERLM